MTMMNRVMKLTMSSHWKLHRLLLTRNASSLFQPRPTSLLSFSRRRALAWLLLSGSTISLAAAYRLKIHLDAEASGVEWSKVRAKALKDANKSLGRIGETILPIRTAGFERFDFAQIGSNEPIEDYHSELFVPYAPNGAYWSFFTIFDGHSGYQTAAWLRDTLLPSVSRSLLNSQNPTPTHTDIDQTIKETFLALDREIVMDALENAFKTPSMSAAREILARANAGSCALMAFYDSSSRTLKIANTGDCRAILGRRKQEDPDSQNQYSVEQLSFDHDGLNASEVSRLTALHPNEDLFSPSGRFIGWGPTRAFGDGRTKWSADQQTKLKESYLGRTPAKTLKTPPYFTAEPEITTTKVREGDFMVMASDGLWECLTNEEVVSLVGGWIEARRPSSAYPTPPPSPTLSASSTPSEADKKAMRYAQWNKPKSFTFDSCQSDSSAQHLLRNALGGADEDLRAALLGLGTPMARSFRDDISVTVVFF